MAIYHEDIVDIELESGTIHRSFLNHSIGYGDDDANRFGVRAFRNGEPENLGATCAGYFIRADGATVVIADGVVSGNLAYVTLPEACYAVEGNFTLAIKVSGSGVTGTMRIVDGVVSRTSTDVVVDPGTIIPSVEDLIDAINAAVASVPAEYDDVWTTFAPNFSSTTAYSKGEFVTYNGALYRFTTDHAAGSWNSSHVTAVNVGNEIHTNNDNVWKAFAPNFSSSTAYTKGQYVTYGEKLYRFTTDHAAGSWNSSHVTAVNAGGELATANANIATNTEDIATNTEDIAENEGNITKAFADIAPTFDATASYLSGQYVIYNGSLYRFKVDHTGAWSSSDVIAVDAGGELSDLEKIKKPASDMIGSYGEDKEGTITLVGEVVPYRYQQGTRVNTQTSLRFTLPKNVKTVDIDMIGHYHINSYTFLDENDTVLSYKYESETAEVSYTDLNAWEAAYLVCGNNNDERDSIVVTAKIRGMDLYIDEAKKAAGDEYTLLRGTPNDTYYKLLVSDTGNYSVEFDIDGYDFVEITSMNASSSNKYTMFDEDNNVVNFFYNNVDADWQQTTTVKVCVPSNAVKMLVGTYRVQRPNVVVYGIKKAADYEWTACGGTFANYYAHGTTVDERTNGSKEFAAEPFDILRMANGVSGNGVNIFTAFDENDNVIGYVSFSSAQNDAYFICPKGTVKVAMAAGVIGGGGWNTAATYVAEKRKTSGKLSVMGDSISTYKNFLPSGNATYYENGNRGVPSASYVWWGVVAREKGWGISTINAWSGSEVATPRSETSAMCMTRTAALAENGTPDVIIILGGINDFLQEVPIGTWAGRDDIPTTGENFRKAYAMMLNKIHTNYPLAKVYCCTLINCNRDNVPGNLENIGGQWLHEFNDAIRQIAPMMNCSVIDLDTCGINQYNLETYMGDYNTSTEAGLHPNAAGHSLIAERVLKMLI